MIRLIDDEVNWKGILSRVKSHDFYHVFSYHELEAERIGARPVMVVAEASGSGLAIPLLIRHIPGTDFLDATSVYGYSGPIYWGDTGKLRRIAPELKEAFASLGIVSVFSRLHPLINDVSVIDTLGEIATVGNTVSIDLQLSQSEQIRKYRSNHRSGIKKLAKLGYTCRLSSAAEDLDTFTAVYEETMHRVGATDMYFFPLPYLKDLFGLPDHNMRLVICERNDIAVAGGMFSFSSPYVAYHLGGTLNAYLKDAPMKLIFDYVRQVASQGKFDDFHLGGGIGGQEDSLFNFKRGFSDKVLPFKIWKWVVRPDLYSDLCIQRGKPDRAQGFFPSYR